MKKRLMMALGLAFIFLLSTGFASAVSDSDLIAHYKFEGNLNDEVRDYDAVNYGVGFENGKDGQSGVFVDGDYGEVKGGKFIFEDGTDFSFSVWVKIDSDASGRETIVQKRNEAGTQGFIFFIEDDIPQLWVSTDSKNSIWLKSSKSISRNIWHHLAGVVDREGYMRIYVDGVETASEKMSLSGDVTTVNSKPFLIGSDAGGAEGRFFEGKMEDLYIYGRELGGSEIEELMGDFYGIVLTSDNPERTVVVDGITYELSLLSSSDSDATIKVNGNSIQIAEGTSKVVGGLEVFIEEADENNLGLYVLLRVSSEGGNVTQCTTNWLCSFWSNCENDKNIRKCVDLNGCGTAVGKPSEMMDCDSSKVVTLRLVVLSNKFSGFTDDKIMFEDNDGTDYLATIFSEGNGAIYVGSEKYNLKYYDDPSIEDDGYVEIDGKIIREGDFYLELMKVVNSSVGFADDEVVLRDIVKLTYDATILSEGNGRFYIDGREYTLKYYDNRMIADDEYMEIDGKVVFKRQSFDNTFELSINGNAFSCENVGLRKSGEYCSADNLWVEQKKSESICENSFECDSNLCVDDKCVSAGLWRKIINWFGRIFG